MDDCDVNECGPEALVDEANDGERLDRALALVLPDSGLRLRRRLIEAGRALLDGRPATPGRRVRLGQRMRVLEPLPGLHDGAPAGAETAPQLPIAARTAGYAALVKPAGLHSAAICGSCGQSVEALLPGLFPGERPTLLNRLDQLTSGLLLVALNPGTQRAYAAMNPRKMVKEYVAVVHGVLDPGDGELALRFILDADDRKRTRVVARLNPDETGWTRVWPLAELPGERTLVRVRIVAGARHQIRAHLAFAGLPILGDPLYGVEGDGAPRMYLHHRLLEFPGFRAVAEPQWPDPASLIMTPGMAPGGEDL